MGRNPAKIYFRTLFTVVFTLLIAFHSDAQRKTKKKSKNEEEMNFLTQEINESSYDRSGTDNNYYFDFKNLNKAYDYYNREELD